MPVLKQFKTTPAMREAIVLDLGDIGAQAARIRAAAETQAAKIISEAEIRAEQIARERAAQAQESGYKEGLEAGLAEGRSTGHAEALAQAAEKLQQLTEAWSQVIEGWEAQRVEMEREARQSVLNFALLAAEKLVHRVIEVDESVIVDQAGHALSLVLSAQNATVRIHPVDRPILNDALPQLINEMAGLEHVELVEDESITPGGCVVAFGQGSVDATIERQLGRLIDMILPGAQPLPTLQPDATASVQQQVEQAQAIEEVEQVVQADPQASAQDAPTKPVDEDLIAPVYEITEQGLVEANGAEDVVADEPESAGDVVDDLVDETDSPEAPDSEV